MLQNYRMMMMFTGVFAVISLMHGNAIRTLTPYDHTPTPSGNGTSNETGEMTTVRPQLSELTCFFCGVVDGDKRNLTVALEITAALVVTMGIIQVAGN